MENVVMIRDSPSLTEVSLAGSCQFTISHRSEISVNVSFKLTTEGARAIGVQLDPSQSENTRRDIKIRTNSTTNTTFTVFARNDGTDHVRIDAIVRDLTLMPVYFQFMLVNTVKFPGVEPPVEAAGNASDSSVGSPT